MFDGATGTQIQARAGELDEARDFLGLDGCNEILCRTRPDLIGSIHESYLAAGADVIETNSFGANAVVLGEYGIAEQAGELNRRAAEIARAAAERFSTPGRPRFVAGAMGPGTKLPSLGQIDFDTLAEAYCEQSAALIAGGADILLIETCQDILQAKAAAVGAGEALERAGRTLPVIVQVTLTPQGTMLVGTDIAAALAILDPYDFITAIGINCAAGPAELSEHVRYLCRRSRRPVSVQPNAGLPEMVDGQVRYPLGPAEFARWMGRFVREDGVRIVGGCCGTTPEHIKAISDCGFLIADVTESAIRNPQSTSIASLYSAVEIRQEPAPLIIGERANANGSRQFRQLLERGDLDGQAAVARAQANEGAHVIDLCTAFVGRDEAADMTRLVSRLATESPLPLMIDSTEPAAIEAALKRIGGRAIVNSINLEDGGTRAATVCRLAKRYGAALVALTIDEQGMARTAEHKLRVARRLAELAGANGLGLGDLLFDPLTFTLGSGDAEFRRAGIETLEAVRRIKRELPGSFTLLGVSNISFGLSPAARQVLNSVFLHHAVEAGLDAAIVHAGRIMPLNRIAPEQRDLARRVIFDERTADSDPLRELIAACGQARRAARVEPGPASVEERLKRRIIDGNAAGLDGDLDEALKSRSPLEIVNNILLDGMKAVGELFGGGEMQLPFVLQSAETMKAAVKLLEPRMDRDERSHRGTIVLATVRGDVHDIGKNLVDIILSNNGYRVVNLGIKQTIGQVLEAARRHRADAIGLSGLLVKSTQVMREDLAELARQGETIPVLLGGAALTRSYVETDLRSVYAGEVRYCKDAFDALRAMDGIVSGTSGRPLSEAASGEPAPREAPRATATPARSDIRPIEEPPKPPFWGARVLDNIPLDEVLAFLNRVMLFQVHWQFRRGGRSPDEYARHLETDVQPIFDRLVGLCRDENIIQPRAAYGYWPAASDGNDLIVFDPAGGDDPAARFAFPRQTHPPFLCISDYFLPISSSRRDVAAIQLVTVGERVSQVERQWFAAGKYRDYLFLHGLGVESAEAAAEMVHKRVRTELGIAGEDAADLPGVLGKGYRGCRYSFGYPACPELADQAKLWALLAPERIGVRLSEQFQLEPEQSISAVIVHHPAARYFAT